MLKPMKTTHHLILVLDEELDTLDGGSGGLGDGLQDTELLRNEARRQIECSTYRRHTTHHEVDYIRVPGQQSILHIEPASG